MSENKVAEIMKTDEGKISDMGTLLFTEDELYSNRPYKDVEDWERQKAEAIKQCRYNNLSLIHI